MVAGFRKSCIGTPLPREMRPCGLEAASRSAPCDTYSVARDTHSATYDTCAAARDTCAAACDTRSAARDTSAATYDTCSATSSAMASDEVSPGDSIPNRFTSPSMPWVSGPWMTKSGAVSPGP